MLENYSKTPPYDHSELTTNPLLRPQFLGTTYFSTVIQWLFVPKLRPPRYSTNATRSISIYAMGFQYNPYLLIYVCYPCICKYFRIKICLNQCDQSLRTKTGVFLSIMIRFYDQSFVCPRASLSTNEPRTLYGNKTALRLGYSKPMKRCERWINMPINGGYCV